MRCPNCDKNLLVIERSGIELDYCPGCRGVWLDRGELEKFIDRAGHSSRIFSEKMIAPAARDRRDPE
jgi:Zn-finger nucleic acid-binding protein